MEWLLHIKLLNTKTACIFCKLFHLKLRSCYDNKCICLIVLVIELLNWIASKLPDCVIIMPPALFTFHRKLIIYFKLVPTISISTCITQHQKLSYCHFHIQLTPRFLILIHIFFPFSFTVFCV